MSQMECNQEFVELTQPLSPVLNSSKSRNKSKRKLLSNKKIVGTKIFETEYNTEHDIKDSSINSLPIKSDYKPDILLNRDIDTVTNSEIVSSTFGFKSASGKELSSKSSSSNYASKLFIDILDSTSSHKRKNKYNFLSSISSEKGNCGDEEFSGFQIEEYISSMKKFENLQKVVNTLFNDAECMQNNCESNKKKSYNKEKRKCEDLKQNYNYEIKRQKTMKMNMKSHMLQNDQLNSDGIHEIVGLSYKKNPEESSQRGDDLISFNVLSANSENHKNDFDKTQNMLEFYPQSKDAVNLNKPKNYNNIPSNADNKISVSLELTNHANNSFNVGSLKENKTSTLKVISNTQIGNMLQFSTASGKKISISNDAFKRANCILKDTQVIEECQIQSTCSKQKKLPSVVNTQDEDDVGSLEFKMSNQKTIAQKNINFSEKQSISALGFSTASGKDIKVPAASLSKLNQIFKDIPDVDDLTNNIDSHCFSNAANYTVPNARADNKFESSIMETDTTLQTTSLEIKDNFSTPVRNTSRKRRLGNSVSREGKFSDAALNRAKSLFGDMNFDDLKLPGFLQISSSTSTPIRSSKTISTPQNKFNYMSTPTKQVPRSYSDKNLSFSSDFPQEYNCPLLIQKPTSGNLLSWDEELQRQKLLLEKKLNLISKKREALHNQIHASSMQETKKQPPSISKKINKFNLMEIQYLEKQSGKLEKINNVILQINPQNAVLIHFNGKWLDSATVTTEDGCTLIPTQQGLVGLSEIEPAFCALSDIKKSLIPEGWIKNHYKWIIWKLASYERFFPSTLGGCFTVDNVIKQLKYRYYRELFCAERPALRKIYEMDDISQRRMVLCISNIFKNGDNIELELTDGWYSIRALIDEPLCHQVTKKKIRIGSKLITSGAELINCEGCYPLEFEEAQKVRLKLHFNSTRRATWFSKLGYQKSSLPLVIKVGDAHPAGGVLGVVKVYIMRTYPFVYREKINNSFVWRNQNAENKMVQEYENKFFNGYEDVFENSSNTKNDNVITCRKVCPVFQMTVIDVLDKKPKIYTCTVWDANEFHIQHLKENQIILIYNLSLRSTNELSCNKKTRFEISNHNPIEYIKYKRKYVAIASYDVMLNSSSFGLFDTIGFVVETCVEEENQYFWLTDISKSLLLVEINEAPNRCILLNRIQNTQPVVICNLSLKESCEGYVVATGYLNTIVTHYHQNEYLREELEKLKRINKTELDIIVKDVKSIVNAIQKNKTSKNTSYSSGSSNTLNFSRVTSTDIVMSMINIDDVVNSTL